MNLIDRIETNFKRIGKSPLLPGGPFRSTPFPSLIRSILGAPAFIMALIFEILFFSFAGEGFLSIGNFINLLRQGSVLVLPALGMTYVILCAEIDLSVGALMSLSGVLVAILMNKGTTLLTASIVALLVGSLVGLLNGLLTTKGRIPSFIVTLSMLGMAKGIALVLTDGESVRLPAHPFFRVLADGYFLSLPNLVWSAILIFLFFFMVLKYTKIGFHVYEVGSNENAAQRMGTNIVVTKNFVFFVSGFLSSLSGILLISRMNSAHPTAGIGFEFEAIASTVLGGTIFEGGKGGLVGTMAGVVIITILRNGLNMMGLNTALQLTVFGLIIILALSFDIFHYRGGQKNS
jgi:ribose transport system permease protein